MVFTNFSLTNIIVYKDIQQKSQKTSLNNLYDRYESNIISLILLLYFAVRSAYLLLVSRNKLGSEEACRVFPGLEVDHWGF